MHIAIDGTKNATVYVGPVSSYYEFWQPAEQRLTDEEWRKRLATDPPPRPIWVTEFEADSIQRLPVKRVTALRRENQFMFKIENAITKMGVSAATIRHMAKEPALHSLDLSNSEIDDDSLRPLSNLRDLRSLNLSGTKITDACSERLKEYHHLQFLDLSATALTDAILPSLTDLVYLSHIDLRCTQVTDAGVQELRRKMTDADVLHGQQSYWCTFSFGRNTNWFSEILTWPRFRSTPLLATLCSSVRSREEGDSNRPVRHARQCYGVVPELLFCISNRNNGSPGPPITQPGVPNACQTGAR